MDLNKQSFLNFFECGMYYYLSLQLCTLVGAEVGLLKEGLLQLLRSENLDILSAITPNLPHIIATMHKHNAITPQSSVSRLKVMSCYILHFSVDNFL